MKLELATKMTIYDILTTTQARIDLHNIDDYISNELLRPDSALRIINSIERKIKTLTIFPERGEEYKTENPDIKSVRIVNIKKYRIVYHINKKHKTISILHIIYSKRDLDRIIK